MYTLYFDLTLNETSVRCVSCLSYVVKIETGITCAYLEIVVFSIGALVEALAACKHGIVR